MLPSPWAGGCSSLPRLRATSCLVPSPFLRSNHLQRNNRLLLVIYSGISQPHPLPDSFPLLATFALWPPRAGSFEKPF